MIEFIFILLKYRFFSAMWFSFVLEGWVIKVSSIKNNNDNHSYEVPIINCRCIQRRQPYGAFRVLFDFD